MANNNDMLGSLMNMLSQDGAKEKMADMLSGLLGNQSGSNQNQPSQNDSAPPHPPSNNNNSNPLGGLGNIADLLGGSGSGITPENMEMIMKAKNMFDRFNDTSDNRIVLLNAIRPFMGTGRGGGIDMMVKLIQVMNFSSGMRNTK